MVGVSVHPSATEALVILSLDGREMWLDVSHLRRPDAWEVGISFTSEEGRGISSLDGVTWVAYLAAKAPPKATMALLEISEGERREVPIGSAGFVFYALWDQAFLSDSPFPRPISYQEGPD